MMPVTLGNMAKAIRGRDTAGYRAFVDRIRNYADVGLLDIVGPTHPGTGKERLFSDAMLMHAAVLSTLQDAGIAPTFANKFLRSCPDLSIGRVTIRLTETVSLTIDGRKIANGINHRVVPAQQEAA